MLSPPAIGEYVAKCLAFEADAISRLADLSADPESIEYFYSHSLHGGQAALAVVRSLPPGCPFRIQWAKRHQDRRNEWVKVHHGLVVAKFRNRMYGTRRNDSEDYAQEFWIKFFAEGQELRYDITKATEAGFLHVRLRFEILQATRESAIASARNLPLPDKDPVQAPLEYDDRTTLQRLDSAQVERIIRLIYTDQIRPHQAVVFLAGRMAGLSPRELAAQFDEMPLFELCAKINGIAEEKLDQTDPPPLPQLRARLELPQESPEGNKTLAQIAWVIAFHSGSDRRRHEAATLARRLELWSNQAARVFSSELGDAGNGSLELYARNVEARFRATLKVELDFLLADLTSEGADVAQGALWACSAILHLADDALEQTTLKDVFRTLRARLALLVEEHPVIELLVPLCELVPDDPVSDYLKLTGSNMNRLRDTVNTRFRRWRKKESERTNAKA